MLRHHKKVYKSCLDNILVLGRVVWVPLYKTRMNESPTCRNGKAHKRGLVCRRSVRSVVIQQEEEWRIVNVF